MKADPSETGIRGKNIALICIVTGTNLDIKFDHLKKESGCQMGSPEKTLIVL